MKTRINWKRAIWLVLFAIACVPALLWSPVAGLAGSLWWALATYFERQIEVASDESDGVTEAGDSSLAGVVTAPFAVVTFLGFIPALFCWEHLQQPS